MLRKKETNEQNFKVKKELLLIMIKFKMPQCYTTTSIISFTISGTLMIFFNNS